MVLVHGPDPVHLEKDGDAFADVMVRALGRALDAAAKTITSTSDPADVRRALYGRWATETTDVIEPEIIEQWRTAADDIHTQVQDAANDQVRAAGDPAPGAPNIPLADLTLAQQYLATRSNYLVGIADEAWFEVRALLLEGEREGEGIPELRNRVLKVLDVTETRATAIARTEVVGASNAGALTQMEEVADALGTSTITKTWLATLDPRTRESHMRANGQKVPLSGRFKVGGWSMDRPHAEGQAPPKEVVNCRCTMTFDLDDDDLTASGISRATLNTDTGGGEMPWHIVENHAECGSDEPWAVVKNDDGEVEGCHATEAEAQAQMDALYAVEEDEEVDAKATVAPLSDALRQAFETGAEMDFDAAGAWEGTIVVEGVATGDGREFAADSLEWGDLPIPLRWNIEDSHGGMPQTKAVLVGRIDTIQRVDGRLEATGVFDLGGDNGRECHRLVEGGFLKGVSVDVDDVADADIEYVFPDGEDGEDPGGLDALFMMPEKMIFNHGRVRAATMCDIPAFIEAEIRLVDMPTVESEGDDVAAAAVLEEARQVVTAAATAELVKPPREWFENPKLSVYTPIVVTDDGRIYGHVAEWTECHIGYSDFCIDPPHEDSHPYYMTGEMLCSDGSRVAVGQITVGTGHAEMGIGARAATAHYDNTGASVADVSVGNDEIGIWLAGALRPDASASQIRDLRAAGRVSGDWRRIGGQLRLVGLLAINVAGFPGPSSLSVRVASGVPQALVAAGRPRALNSTPRNDRVRAGLLALREDLTKRVLKGGER